MLSICTRTSLSAGSLAVTCGTWVVAAVCINALLSWFWLHRHLIVLASAVPAPYWLWLCRHLIVLALAMPTPYCIGFGCAGTLLYWLWLCRHLIVLALAVPAPYCIGFGCAGALLYWLWRWRHLIVLALAVPAPYCIGFGDDDTLLSWLWLCRHLIVLALAVPIFIFLFLPLKADCVNSTNNMDKQVPIAKRNCYWTMKIVKYYCKLYVH